MSKSYSLGHIYHPEHDGARWTAVYREVVAYRSSVNPKLWDIYAVITRGQDDGSPRIVCPLSQGYRTLRSARLHAGIIADTQDDAIRREDNPLLVANRINFSTISRLHYA